MNKCASASNFVNQLNVKIYEGTHVPNQSNQEIFVYNMQDKQIAKYMVTIINEETNRKTLISFEIYFLSRKFSIYFEMSNIAAKSECLLDKNRRETIIRRAFTIYYDLYTHKMTAGRPTNASIYNIIQNFRQPERRQQIQTLLVLKYRLDHVLM